MTGSIGTFVEKEILSHSRIGVDHTLGFVAIAAGLVTTNKLANSREIKAHKNPKFKLKEHDYMHYRTSKELFYRSQPAAGMAVASAAVSFGLAGKAPLAVSRAAFFGPLAAGLILNDTAKGVPLDRAMVASAGAVTAGLVAHKLGSEFIPKGLVSLGEFMKNNVSGGIAEVVEESVAHLRKVSPTLARLFSSEGVGIAAAIATVPVAHAMIGKLLNFHKRKYRDPSPDQTSIGFTTHSQAGANSYRGESAQQFMPRLPQKESTLNMSSSIRTHYDKTAVAGAYLAL